MRNGYWILVGKPEGKRQKDLDVGGGIVLKLYQRWMGWY
jgi:hypothetical protein